MTAHFDDATRAQIDAARPDASTWLGANAGSGKTRVLTDRVARLLLNGVEPQHILCLTYTKAAASEMQNRLFKRLGAWAMLKDNDLRASLAELGVTDAFTPEKLRMARTLFARAIETPGGLKIQTIHSFCASLLRRFPLEAGVSPQFTEIEDRAADLLRAEIVDKMVEGHDGQYVVALARHYTGEDFSKLTRAIVREREGFETPLAWGNALALFDQPADLTEENIASSVFMGSESSIIDQMVSVMKDSGVTDQKNAEKLRSIGVLDITALPILEGVFLTGGSAASPFSAKIGSVPTKAAQKALSHIMSQVDDLMSRVESARNARLSLKAAQRTFVLHQFAHAFLKRYALEKQKRGWLDFDDLILKARALLTDPAVAAWVLYRIDGGIDHILVDEAQDTSPRQWDVIERLTDEFYSGDGANDGDARTLFVVGDKKQSIYSFQGADPREFDHKQTLFEGKITDAGQLFQRRSLDYSFRSSSAILQLVDTSFTPHASAGFAADGKHIAFKSALPGRVDLWPLVEKSEEPDDREWSDPVDQQSDHHHTVVLADKIAAQIKTLTQGEHYLPVDADVPGGFERRRIRAGDFLILVQRRSALFSEIIRACKTAGLPIAGADRLKVGAELAVKDLAALLSFLATPEDSLSLATALKSPLFGWSEQMLFKLSHYRTEDHLWQALRDNPDYPETVEILRDLRDKVDFLRPYDLIERILTRHEGRRKLLARLGPEAEDGINAMLAQALSYERGAIPSLTGFLVWMQTDDLEIKRQIDNASDQIRVMTVHGAKGLEAPIVILPDTGKRNLVIRDEIIKMGDTPVWKMSDTDMPSAMRDALDARKDRERDERLRLLYVAMTRAEKWLIVAAAGDLPKDDSSWYQMIGAAMGQAGATPVGETGKLRFQYGDWDGLPIRDHKADTPNTPVLEPVFLNKLTDIPHRPETKSPSDLGGAKALPGEDGMTEDEAKAYGTLVHKLLETMPALPTDNWDGLLRSISDGYDPTIANRALQEAVGVMSKPEISHIFAPDALLEVPVTAQLPKWRIHGTIDRLLVSDTDVLAIDFKTNRVVPATPAACPDGILRQMGAYAAALAQVFPNHRIRTAILWTRNAQLMELPGDMITNALSRAVDLDEGTVAT
ncbi:double-strand break repair helicase AddA [uncultured Sulfitobacter sp.]|uniref:double-strand break repair helicase AddA n=1 Tax=uncultured Sulfitobacter sp. TaxID=191468 RepID=UPI0030D84372|tara:strand:- start:112750 stop:116127 length:3378 start_codon:yes stop_codon:yes gene_type:complete